MDVYGHTDMGIMKSVMYTMGCHVVKVWQRRLCVARRLMRSSPPYRNICSINCEKLSYVNCIIGKWAMMEIFCRYTNFEPICVAAG
jgi:hypothetical protein